MYNVHIHRPLHIIHIYLRRFYCTVCTSTLYNVHTTYSTMLYKGIRIMYIVYCIYYKNSEVRSIHAYMYMYSVFNIHVYIQYNAI